MIGRRIVSAALGGLLLVGACSSDDSSIGSAPGSLPEPTNVAGVAFAAVDRIGSGRAVAAAATGAGSTVVGLTTGVTVEHDDRTVPVPTDVVSPAGVGLSVDGRRVFIRASDGRAEIWTTAAQPGLTATFDGVQSVSFVGDSGDAVVASASTVSIVDDEDGVVTDVLDAPAGGSFQRAAVATDGSWVLAPVAGSENIDAMLWTPEEGAVELTLGLEADEDIVRAVAVPGEERVVLGVASGGGFDARLVSLGLLDRTFEWSHGVDGDVSGISWDASARGSVMVVDGDGLVSVGPDGGVSPVPGAGDSPVRAVVAAGSWALARADGSIDLVDDSGAVVSALPSSGVTLLDVGATSTRSGLVTVDFDGRVREWSSDGGLVSDDESHRAGTVNDVTVSADGTRLALATSTGAVEIVSLETGDDVIARLDHPEGNVDSVSLAADGSSLLSGVGVRKDTDAFDDTVSVWDLASSERRFAIGGEAESVQGCAFFRNKVAFAPDGAVFAASSHDFVVSIWRTADGGLVHSFPAHRSTVLDLAWSPSGDRLATAADDGMVREWTTDDFELVAEHVAPPGGFWSVQYLPDGRLLTSDVTGAVAPFDLRDGTTGAVFDGEKTRESRIAVSSDGALAAAAADGDLVRVWSVADGRILAELVGHDAPVTAVSFTADGSSLVSGSRDATAIIWSAEES